MTDAAAREPYSYRQDPDVPSFPDDKPLLVFDGHCVLCSRGAQFVIRHDRTGRYRLLAAQSRLGQALYRHYGVDPVALDTMLLIEDGRLQTRLDAAIRIAVGLGMPWSAAAALRVLPHGWRDRLYDTLARNRLRVFGRRESCYLPGPSEAGRFLS